MVVINNHASVSEAWRLAQGTKIASDGLKGRVYEFPLVNLQNENDAERLFRKFKLVCEEVQVGIDRVFKIQCF